MSALLALADAATTILSDEECGSVNASQPSDDASSVDSSHSDADPAVVPACPAKMVGNNHRLPAKKRIVPQEATVKALPNINARRHHPPMPMVIPQPQARPHSFARAQLSALYPVHLQAQLPNRLPAQSAPPMPLSMLPKKKRKKKEERCELEGQYLATSWYFNESSFPVTLMAIIESQGSQSPCIAFLSDNKRFVIIDPSRLEKEIFPKHFDLRKPTLEEFGEMLTLWGFKTSVDKLFPNVTVYEHDQFMKGDWEKCLKIEMPLESLEKISKIKAQVAKAKEEAERAPSPKEVPRKRQRRRGNGVPLPPAELVAGFPTGAVQQTPRVASIPRRITQEMVNPFGKSSLGNGPAAKAQPLLLSQLQSRQKQALQSMLLSQKSNPQLHQNLVNRNFFQNKSSFDVNQLRQKNPFPRPSPAATGAVGVEDLPFLNRSVSDEAIALRRKLSSKQLDAMTEQFIAQSNARLKSRPAGIRGPTNMPHRNSLTNGSANGVQPGQFQLQAMLASRQRQGNIRRRTMF